MSVAILKLLSPDEFRSGENISRELGISRASVHNAVARARELGAEIHAVRGKGYRLAKRYSWLEHTQLIAGAVPHGYDVLLHEELGSTNSHLLSLAQQGQGHKSVVAAEWQREGRGRRGRTWLGQLGGGLTFSLLWRFNRPLTALSGLSLAVGVALARSLRGLGVAAAAVKWPNDILVEGRKLAGILIETHGDVLSPATAVIGIGINVLPSRPLADQVGQPVACLADALDPAPDRNAVLLAVLAELRPALELFDSAGFAPFAEPWQHLHAWQGKAVRVLGGGGDSLEGVAQGVDDAGVLLLQTESGIRRIHSGEVSLRLGDTP